jgi:hypothetical protein
MSAADLEKKKPVCHRVITEVIQMTNQLRLNCCELLFLDPWRNPNIEDALQIGVCFSLRYFCEIYVYPIILEPSMIDGKK